MRYLLTLLLTLVGAHAQGLIINPFYVAPSCTSITAQTAVFDGNDYLYKNTGLNGVADGKQFTLSVWWKPANSGVVGQFLHQIVSGGGTATRFQVSFTTGNGSTAGPGPLRIDAFSSTGVNVLTVTSDLGATNGTWHHFFVAVDLSDNTKRHLYVDGVERTVTWSPYSNTDIDFVPASGPATTIGADYGSGGNKLNGTVAELWFDDVYLNDVTKFRCLSDGKPAFLGSNGSLPTGSVPAFYQSTAGSGDTWATDSSGNNTWGIVSTLGTGTPP